MMMIIIMINNDGNYVVPSCYSLTLNWVGGVVLPRPPLPPSWFSLNNSKMVKAVTLEFCNVQYHSIRDIFAIFGIHNSPQSPDIGQTQKGVFPDFRSIPFERKLS